MDNAIYRWTFHNGRRARGDGWSIAIPDGFVVTESLEGRAFESRPDMEEDDNGYYPILILPGVETISQMGEDMWLYHPIARAGIAKMIYVDQMGLMKKMTGIKSEIMSCGFSDIAAIVLIGHTADGTYSYQCSLLTAKKQQLLRVQTLYAITADRKKDLSRSVIEWLQTFRFDEPNPYMPKEAKIESSKVLNDLLKGDFASFKSALESADLEYKVALGSGVKSLKAMVDDDLLDEDDSIASARETLAEAMGVDEFYHIKADELVEKLKDAHVSAPIMKEVYSQLKGFINVSFSITINGKEITVNETDKIKEIQKKWEKGAAEKAISQNTEERRAGEQNKSREETQRIQEELKRYESDRKSYDLRKSKEREARRTRIEQDIRTVENSIVDLNYKRLMLDKKEKSLQQDLKRIQGDIDELEDAFAESKAQIEEAAEALLRQKQAAIDEAREELLEAKKTLDDIQVQVDELSFFRFGLKKELLRKTESIKNSLPTITEKLKKLQTECDEIKAKCSQDVESLEKEIQKEKQRIENKSFDLSRIPRERKKIDQEIEKAKKRAESHREALKRI